MCVRIADLTSIYYIFSMIIRHVRGAMWLLILLLRWEPYMSPRKKSSVEFVQVLGVCHWQSSLGRPARFVSGKRKYSYQVGMLYFPQEMDSRAEQDFSWPYKTPDGIYVYENFVPFPTVWNVWFLGSSGFTTFLLHTFSRSREIMTVVWFLL